MADEKPSPRLTLKERIIMGLGGVILVALTIWMILAPLTSTTNERDANGTIVSSVETPRDYGEATLLLGGVGLVTLFLAINGLRFTRISFGDFSANTTQEKAEVAFKEYADRAPEPREVTIEEDQPNQEAIAPLNERAPSVAIANEKEAIYPLEAVPRRVLDDLFANWPGEYPKPSNFSTFEFAARRIGQGNLPWLIKFKDLPAIKISYGGKGKAGPTVAADD